MAMRALVLRIITMLVSDNGCQTVDEVGLLLGSGYGEVVARDESIECQVSYVHSRLVSQQCFGCHPQERSAAS